MNIARFCLVVLLAGAFSPLLRAQSESYDDVMLIINDSSRNSVEIGAYFASRRGIPQRNILHITADTSETMDSAAFIPLKWQIQSWMAANNLVDSINYIVTTKGCPLRIRTRQGDVIENGAVTLLGGQSSFEDCLALINGSDSTAILASREQFFTSRYYNSTQHFRHDRVTMPYYLVTRLDAYTVDQVKGYIRKAEEPALLGEGAWVLDIDPGRENPSYGVGNTWLRDAAAALRNKSLQVVLDTTDTYLHDQRNVIGYASWGSNDGHGGGGEGARPGNTWLNGAIAETYVSTSGRSFQPGTGYGQSLVADWIAEGASAVKGYTDEPYLTVMAEPDILFDRYTSGFNMAESYWAASRLIAWRQVVIGDPKMRLRVLLASPRSRTVIGSAPRYADITSDIWLRNVSAIPVEVTGATVDGDDAGDFQAHPAGGFPFTIPAGDSVAVPVTFRPVSYGGEDATIRFRHRRGANDTLSFSVGIPVSGTGLRPVLAAPDTVVFSASQGGSVTRMVTLTNETGSDTISVTKLALGGAGSGNYTIDPSITYPHVIPGGASWEVMVTYTAPSAGAAPLATLAVSSNIGKTINVRLRATDQVSSVGPAIARTGDMGVDVMPNPFSSSTVIRYRTIGRREHVVIDLLDLLGRPVGTIIDGMESAGEHSVVFRAGELPAGIYICRLVVEGAEGTRTITRSLLHID